MKYKCVEIGVLQGFVDGELGNKETEKVVSHLSFCEECRLELANLESEGDLVFSAMESEYNVLVPTERLRAKVFASIDEIESRSTSGLLEGLWSGFGNLLMRPGFATVAGVLLLAAFFTAGYRFLNGVERDGPAVAGITNPNSDESKAGEEQIGAISDSGGSGEIPLDLTEPAATQILPQQINVGRQVLEPSNAVTRPTRKRVTDVATAEVTTAAAPLKSADLDAEEGYLTTIATLSRSVNENKDYVMRPSERVVYERNLAVVDDAIKKMKSEVRNDPDNTAAREVLRSSYKNKIDLLNSVAGRTETVASVY